MFQYSANEYKTSEKVGLVVILSESGKVSLTRGQDYREWAAPPQHRIHKRYCEKLNSLTCHTMIKLQTFID